MPHQLSRLTGLIGISATIALVQPSIASAKTSVEIGETAKAVTVLITEPDSVGSGVILQQQGDIYTVLTAAHVVKNKVSYKITTPDDRSHLVISSSIRRAPGSIDLAVIKFKSTTKYPTVKIGNSNVLKSGMDLYVAGFPGTSRAISQPIFVFREGKVSANSNKALENGYSLVYSNDTLPGMSGGAVLNSDGELVAIHGRGDRDENNVKTGFNLGIPVNRFATVASNMGVELGERVAPTLQNTAPQADDFIASSVQKYRKGDYRGTLADLDRAVQLNPKLAAAYTYRASVKQSKFQDFKGALADYNRSIQLDPNFALAYSNRGSLKESNFQDIPGGLADYDRAIAIDPKLALAYNNRGWLKQSKLRDFRDALADYDRAITIDPNLALAYSNRGLLKQSQLQDIPGSLADLNRAIAIDPNYANAYINRGLLKQSQLQDIPGALADLNRAIQIDPNVANAYNNRGVLKAQSLQDARGGLADLDRAVRLDPNSADARKNRGWLRASQFQDLTGGLADLDRSIALDPTLADAYTFRAMLKNTRPNDRSSAIADLQQAAQLYRQQGNTKQYQWAIDKIKQWQQ